MYCHKNSKVNKTFNYFDDVFAPKTVFWKNHYWVASEIDCFEPIFGFLMQFWFWKHRSDTKNPKGMFSVPSGRSAISNFGIASMLNHIIDFVTKLRFNMKVISKLIIESDMFFGTQLAVSNDLGAKPIQFLKLSRNCFQRKIMTPPLLAARISL